MLVMEQNRGFQDLSGKSVNIFKKKKSVTKRCISNLFYCIFLLVSVQIVSAFDFFALRIFAT